MSGIHDGYQQAYADKLWALLPEVYRAQDTDQFGANGPLRELINRIGTQAANVRRNIDRLWEDQSIETCDDWVIPYLGDLLGTVLVANLDPRAQRLDVAKTIHYRRRKGTLAVTEELALDVTGWTAHAVEGFRRLGRTRHGLDPAVGPAAYPQASPADVTRLMQAEGLTGLLTSGLAGGFADLRSAHGAVLANTAFDESFHAADLRAGPSALATLLVFVWRLISFPVVAGTPVAVAGCPGQYVFDPAGRQLPLFLPTPPVPDDFGTSWTPALEWQVPGPLTNSLEAAIGARPGGPPYPSAVPARYSLGPGWQLTSVWPELGRFTAAADSPPGPLTVSYQYGFPSLIGAGPYDRGLLGDPPVTVVPETLVSGGTALPGLPATGTVTIGDSLTYAELADAGAVVSLLVRAGPGVRPVLRPSPGPDGPPEWTFTGGSGAQLVLDGLTVSGCDIVLRGAFEVVRLTACTVDPGTAADGSPPLATAADGVPLAPCRIFVEADPAAPGSSQIGELLIDHCVLGPVRTRSGGSVATLTITDSIVQGLPATSGTAFTEADVFDPALLARGLAAGQGSPADPVAAALLAAMPPADAAAVLASATLARPGGSPPGLPGAFPLGGLNALVGGPSLYAAAGLGAAGFAAVTLSADVLALAAQAEAGTLEPARLPALNRALLQECFPVALGVAALAVADAAVQLTRVTVLGRIAAHRLSASDSILAGFAAVDDTQDGCVRFSAYVGGSAIPRQYACAVIAAGAPVFTTESYGQPGFAQLTDAADASVTGGAAGTSGAAGTGGAAIAAGAENGSEMGAFCADLNPVKEQGLLAKYAEYLPLGLTPVIVHVT
jgi:hypothetical protein